MEVNGDVITNSREVKLFGVILDSQLNFKIHSKALCMKANREVSTLQGLQNIYTSKKQNTLSIIHCVNVQVLPFDLDILWKSRE